MLIYNKLEENTDYKDLNFLIKSALESSLAGYWDWNMLTNEEYLSPRFKEMFGYKDSEMENSPEAWQQIAFSEDLPAMFESFQKHADSKGTIPFNSVVRYHHKNGKTIWVRCNGKIVAWTEDGKPSRVIGCHVDVTEEKQLELKLKKALAERDVLLSEVHHRVKNNLQLILSIARMNQKENKVGLHEIENTITAIASSYEAIYKTGELDELNISDYLSKVINPLLIGHDVDLNLEADLITKDINFLIPIGMIMSECASNSIKHAFNCVTKNKTLNLSIRKKDDFIHLIYKDSGQGYNEAILDSIDDLNSYGISIIKSLVEKLNGTVHFSNEKGAKIEIKFKTHST